MNVGFLPEQILAWLAKQGANLFPTGQNPPSPGQFQPGQQYDASVLANLANGRSLVEVAGQKLDMQLPQSAKPGDVLNLTYLQSGSRPTFAMAPAVPAGTSSVNLSQAVQQISALIRYVPVGASAPAASPNTPASAVPGNVTAMQAAPATPASLVASAIPSATPSQPILANPAVLLVPAQSAQPAQPSGAVVLSQLGAPTTSMVGEAVEGAHAANSANTSVMTSSVAGGAPSSGNEMLPVRLQQTVKESGLFYESHLGKWVRGEVSLESIHREPQARLAQHPGAMLDLPDLEGMPAKAAYLANRQLNMLDGQPFVWQGQVWPGQDMEWQVGERDGDPQDVEAQKWHSKLSLTLPRMGEIRADLDIGGLGLRIRLSAQSDSTLAEMQAEMPELVDRLKAAGLNLSSLMLEPNHGG